MDVAATLDAARCSAYQRWLVFLTALAVIFDGIDNQLIGIAIPSIMKDWTVSRGAFAPVIAVGHLGMLIGGALGGAAGDRFGRRPALLGSVVMFGMTTLMVPAVETVAPLAALRFLAGIGLGGTMPNAAALAAEYVPLRTRPFAVTLTIVCVPLGGTLAGLAAIRALPAFGWRPLFAMGGVAPLLLSVMLARLLPESPRYLARRPERWPELQRLLARMGHGPEPGTSTSPSPSSGPLAGGRVNPAARSRLGILFTDDFRIDTSGLWGGYFSCLLAVYLGFSWLPSFLTGAGLSTGVASAGLMVFNLGGVVGAIAGGGLITRRGSRRPMLAMAAGAAVGAATLGLMPISAHSAIVPLMVMLTITGGLINAVQTTMYALAANVYPTAVRATGVGAAAAVGRSGAMLSGYAGAWALEIAGARSFFGLMACALAVTFASLALVRRHVPGRPV